MSVVPPPPRDTRGRDELEALIEEARERQRRRRLLAAGAIVLLAGLASGIGEAAGGGSPPRPVAQGGGDHSSSARWCQAATTPAWRSLLARHVVPLPRTTTVFPIALGDDGRTFFANVWSRHFYGVARVDARTGKLQRIKAFPAPQRMSGTGEFDGRWLVWTETRTAPAQGWAIWAWDSHTGRVQRLASSRIGSAETRFPAAVRGGVAAWMRGLGGRGDVDFFDRGVKLYDLRTGRYTIVHGRFVLGPVLLGERLAAWAVGLGRRDDLHWKLRVVSAGSGKTVATPPALLAVGAHLYSLGTDGRQIAYTHLRSLWWSPSLRQPARMIVRARMRHWLDYPVQVDGSYLAFGMEPGVFVGDVRTRSYVEIESGYGSALAGGGALVVARPVEGASKALARMAISFVPLRDMPAMPPCAA